MNRFIHFNRASDLRFVCESFLLIVVFTICTPAQNAPAPEKPVQTVSLCDLVRSPRDFDQKRVRIQATYRYGFEWSELYCEDCLDVGLVWLDFDTAFDESTDKKTRSRIKWSEKGRTVNITAVGKFYAVGKFGHLGGYPFKFVAEYFERAEVILNDSPVTLPAKVRGKASCAIKR